MADTGHILFKFCFFACGGLMRFSPFLFYDFPCVLGIYNVGMNELRDMGGDYMMLCMELSICDFCDDHGLLACMGGWWK